jgi:hypothetical protein
MKLRFEWQPNPPSEQITNYKLSITRNGMALPNSPVSTGTATAHELDNPTPGNYAAFVTAENIAGQSPQSPTGIGPAVPTTPAQPVITTIP